MDNDFATGYALGSDSGNGNNSGFLNGDGWWAIILFAMIFGCGNCGYGGFGGGINSAAGQGALTRAAAPNDDEIQAGQATQEFLRARDAEQLPLDPDGERR